MPELVHVEFNDVHNRLAQLGLEQSNICEVVRKGYVAFNSCTANDPPLYPGFAAWAQTVRSLREYLLPKGWERSDENNYSRVINPTGTIAIAVATGDEATGRREATPATKSSRGTCTIEAVTVNRSQLSLPFDFPPLQAPLRPADANDKMLTWILLVCRATNEIRCELSLPTSMSNDSRVDSWQERIIFGSIPIDPDWVEITPNIQPSPDISIDVKRRT